MYSEAGQWNFIGVAFEHTGSFYTTSFHHYDPATATWSSASQNLPNAPENTENSNYINYLGGLLSDSAANTYTNHMTCLIHFFEWAEGGFYNQADFFGKYLEDCPS